MVDRRLRHETDRVPGRTPAIRELALELVGHADKIFVEATELEGLTPAQREISAHESLDLTTLSRGELLGVP